MAGVLAKEPIDEWIYIDVADQHEDSMRFIKDCEKAIGIHIQILRYRPYNDVESALRMAGMVKMTGGFAPCTNHLKKRVRKEWEAAHSQYQLTYVWGFDIDEPERAKRIIEANPQAEHEFPLLERELSKQDVHGLFERKFGFPRPMMYELSYQNNNCIGCIKGGMGYWNKIRKDFPEVFQKRAELERILGYSILKEADGTPLYLDELEPDRGDMNTEIMPECGVMCYLNS